MGAKHAFLKAGLGWGHMPVHMVPDDLDAGRLVRLDLEGITGMRAAFSMHAIHLRDHPPGPAGRWFVEHLKHGV
jgi:DNA-binding transcriptional LysR family regulator